MMKTVIFGGSGLIGSKLIKILNGQGHETVSASPSQGINAVTGEGLDNALIGADVVIDVMNSPSFEDIAVLSFFESSTNNLIAAATKANIKHYIALSVVGTERLQAGGYFKAKLLQENLIKASKLPYTILRATQFYEFMMGIAQASTDGETVRLSSATLQPVAAADVSKALADIAIENPKNDIVEVAGPEKIGLDKLIQKVLDTHSDKRKVITDDNAPYFGMLVIDDASLTPGLNPRIGQIRYADWLQQSVSLA
ncbi:SDR family oxidoreductase [Methylotenera versatilis]|uniref:SDR family oxidoreductase n=1 Tax=Methylotenera versatilis TaxID=1055487 RepID=UPI00190F7CA2|nr:NAD(P)H-binding protein [Methylotenera versatilis]